MRPTPLSGPAHWELMEARDFFDRLAARAEGFADALEKTGVDSYLPVPLPSSRGLLSVFARVVGLTARCAEQAAARACAIHDTVSR